MPPATEAPPSSKVLPVIGLRPKCWRGGSLTTKATNVTTKATNVTTKATEMATKPSSGVSYCRHRCWSERQAKNDRRRRHGISKPHHVLCL